MKNFKIELSLITLIFFTSISCLPAISQSGGIAGENVSPVSVQPANSTGQLTAPAPQLPLFGSNFFRAQKCSEELLAAGSGMFPKEYVLGAGDRLGIYLLGKSQQNFDVIVNLEGKIFIPTVGVFFVNGVKIEDFQIFLNSELTKYYDNFSANVLLIEPKKIPVFVVGEVQHPGKYFLTSVNTVLDAVVLAGGPTERGSLRNIALYRGDTLCTEVDLYQLFMKGSNANDLFLLTGDKIVVPLLDAVVSVEGEVKREARFELKNNGKERISDLFDLAGGFTDLAFLDKIEISRLLPNGERVVSYLNYHEIENSDSCPSNLLLKNNDQIRVYSILDQTYKKSVFIHGEVKRPGEYFWQENLHVRDLILQAGNLTRSAFLLDCEIARIDPKLPTVVKTVNLQKILQDSTAENNLLLEEDDRVFIRRIPEWRVGPTVEIIGEAKFPGIYAITEDSTTLSEVLTSAGGFTEKALLREATLVRQSSKMVIDKEYLRLKQIPRDQLSKTEYEYLVLKENTQDIGRIVVDFYKLCILKDLSEDVALKDGDIINIPEAPNLIYVTGRVSKPGGVLYEPKKKINYYLEKAGGTTWDAGRGKIKVTKINGEIIDDEDVKKLEPGDIIWVPRKPERDWWAIFRETIAVIAQVATVYLIVDRAIVKK